MGDADEQIIISNKLRSVLQVYSKIRLIKIYLNVDSNFLITGTCKLTMQNMVFTRINATICIIRVQCKRPKNEIALCVKM